MLSVLTLDFIFTSIKFEAEGLTANMVKVGNIKLIFQGVSNVNWSKYIIICSTAITLILTAVSASQSANQAPNTVSEDLAVASAHFPVLNYEFEAVVEGIKATYDFTVQNKGTAVLEIKNVRTG